MNKTFLIKFLADFMLLIALLYAGPYINAKQTEPEEQSIEYVENDFEEDEPAEEQQYIFQNNIPASYYPLFSVRIILNFIGSEGESHEIFVEPLAMGDPNTHLESLLNDNSQELIEVRLKTLVYSGGTVAEHSAGSYDPSYFEQPGLYEFSLNDDGHIVLTNEGEEIPLEPTV